MEAGGVRHKLDCVASSRQVAIRNGWQVHQINDLGKGIAKVRIACVAVARVPTCVHREIHQVGQTFGGDRKSTRLNSSHLVISYAVFCLKKKKKKKMYCSI